MLRIIAEKVELLTNLNYNYNNRLVTVPVIIVEL